MATPRPPELLDDLIPEILLRVSPQAPEVLIRCSAVCKAWRRLLTSAAFLRRYRAFHGRAPLLGVLFNVSLPNDLVVWQFALDAVFRRRVPLEGFVHDARHGRVLFHDFSSGWDIVVWDPVTGDRRELPTPDVDFLNWDATVLCTAHLRGCDHLHCRGRPFLVAFVGTDGAIASACVYSSEDGAWGDAITADHPDGSTGLTMTMSPTALVGNTVYYATSGATKFLEYDLERRKLTFIDKPVARFTDHAVVMPLEGGGLGYAAVQGSSLHLYSRDARPDGTAAWTERRVINLNTLPTLDPGSSPYAAGYAEGLGVIFVATDAGVFAVSHKSGQIKKVFNRGGIDFVIPYMSFYTPDYAAS